MEENDLYFLQPYLFILIGFCCLLFALFKKAGNANLIKTGIKAKGVVYAFGQQSHRTNNQNILLKDKVTIRFLTTNLEWITADLKQDFVIFFSKQYREGEKVDVYYDPENPLVFFVDTNNQRQHLGCYLQQWDLSLLLSDFTRFF